MKTLFFLLMAVSLPVRADYFSCTLKIGYFLSYSEEAPYRGREVTVDQDPYYCNGIIKNDGTVIVTITSKSGPETQTEIASGKGSAETKMTTLDTHGDGLEYLNCKCGLN